MLAVLFFLELLKLIIRAKCDKIDMSCYIAGIFIRGEKNMRIKKGYSLIVVLLCGILFMGGCTQNKKEKSDEKKEEKITLEVYAWADEEKNLKLLADAYSEKHPQIEIHANIIPIEEYRQRMLSLKNGNGQADCIFSPSPAEAILWENKGMLKNLDSYLQDVKEEEYYEKCYQEGDGDSASYMIPYRRSHWAVYYNKTLFDKMGVDYPKQGWTWEDYEETAVQLSGWVDGRKTYGSLSFEPSSLWWRVPARTEGANNPLVYSDLEAFKKSAQWIYHLTYDLGAQQPYTEQKGNGYEYDANFLKGNIGMYFSGDWSATVLNQVIQESGEAFEYDIAPMPHWEGKENYTISDASLISMLEATEHPDETFDFIHFVTGKEGASVLAKSSVIPAWNSDDIIQLYKESAKMPEHTEYFFTEGKVSKVPSTVRYNEGMEIIKDEVSLYLLQEQNIDQTFDNIGRKLEDVW